MSDFNPKSARAKRPCPLWVDAFQRDTQHLGADEVGAYMLILMAMWTRETCDFPDDDARLAKVGRLSLRLWKLRIGPVIRAFFHQENGVLVSKRLREEAGYVERQVKEQSNRKSGHKSGKPLKTLYSDQTTDVSTDVSVEYPSQQPNNPTSGREERISNDILPPPPTGGGGFSDDDFDKLLAAVGYDPAGHIPALWFPDSPVIVAWLERLTSTQIIAAAKASREVHADAPATPQALNTFMDQAAAKAVATPRPTDAQIMAAQASRINGPGFCAASLVTPSQARALIDAGFVTSEKLSERGIAR